MERWKLRLMTEAGRRGFDHQLIKMLQHVLAGFLLAAPPGGHRRHAQIFAQKLAAKAGQEGQVARRLHQPAAQSIVNHHGAVANGLHQAGHAQQGIAAQLEGIADSYRRSGA